MAHDHHHHDQSSYYLEQLCTIGICAALGGVTVMLYYQNTFNFMLATKFHIPVLIGGITLLVMAVIRAVILWRAVGQAAPDHAHDHAHNHGHDHHHGHDHGHDHAHDHDHDHDHAHEELPAAGWHHHLPDDHGHDHSWNPGRYVILLLPIVLFFLNLPNQGFSNPSSNVDVDEFEFGKTKGEGKGDLIPLDFKELEQAAYDKDRREYYEGKRGELTGQYAPSSNERIFTLIRFKITCCAPDAIPLNVMIVSPERIPIKRGKWVRVTGTIQFAKRKDRDEYVPVLHTSKDGVKEIPPDPNPYIQ